MTKFIVGEPVLRKDDPQNRFYVPISRVDNRPEVDSQIVLRIASDAFASDAEAILFGEDLIKIMNEKSNNFECKSHERFLIIDQHGDFLQQDWYSTHKPRELKDFEYRWGKLDSATAFASLKEITRLVKFYTNKTSRLNYKLHICYIAKYEFIKKGSDIVKKNMLEILPDKYETILDEWD